MRIGGCTTTTRGWRRTRSRRTRRCSFTRWGTCCATTRGARRPPASRTIGAGTRPATARSTTISTPRACRCQAIRRCPASMDCQSWRHRRDLLQAAADTAAGGSDSHAAGEGHQPGTTAGRARTANGDSGSCRLTMSSEGGVPGVDRLKAELVRREVARRIDEMSPYAGDVSPGVAPLGPRHARAEGRLHGDHPSCGAPGACATARSAGTTAPTGGRIDGRRATASSSWPASTSRGRGRDF